MTTTIKYWRISDDNKSLILLPSKEGLAKIKEVYPIFTDCIEKIGPKLELLALKLTTNGNIKFISSDIKIMQNLFSIYVYTEKETKYNFTVPYVIP